MSGMKPKFLENQMVQQNYYEKPNPYVTAPSCHVNLLMMSGYARECGKKLTEFTAEEVKKFLIQRADVQWKEEGLQKYVLSSFYVLDEIFAEIAIDKDYFYRRIMSCYQ